MTATANSTEPTTPALSVTGRIATIRLRNPAYANRLSPTDLDVIKDHLNTVNANPDILVLKFVADGKVDTTKVKVFYTTPGYFDYNWTVHADMPAALREKHLVAHRAHLDAWNDRLFFSGPLQNDDASASLGSLFVLNVADRAEAERFIRSHPGALPSFKGLYGFPKTLCISIDEEIVHGIPSPRRVHSLAASSAPCPAPS